MADQSDTPKASGSGGGGGGGSNRNRSRNRNRNRTGSAGGGSAGGSGSGASGGRSGGGTGGGGGGKANASANARKKGQGAGGQRSSAQGRNRSGSWPRNGQGQPRAARVAVVLEPPPPLEPLHVEPSLGAPEILPGEVTANRRRTIVLCAWTAIAPALLFGALFAAAVSPVFGIVAFVVAGVAVMYGVWRLAPSFACCGASVLRPSTNTVTRASTTSPKACARRSASPCHRSTSSTTTCPTPARWAGDARRSDLVVTTGLLRRTDPIELEGVIAHELAHVKRGDNGVSCIGITLGSLFGGETMLRRCVGEDREYRADVVGASAVRYPRGLLAVLRTMAEAPAPADGSFFASPARFGPTRWVWIDPSVGHRDDPLVPGDLDATSVRAAALSEW